VSKITTHVLDTARGCPAQGVNVTLRQHLPNGDSRFVAAGHTDNDGRLRDLLPSGEPFSAGDYELTFDIEGYLVRTQSPVFFPNVRIAFRVEDPSQHHHVPLLLSPFGFATYRGS
jgi:5-hydroxyisourate hydrolase